MTPRIANEAYYAIMAATIAGTITLNIIGLWTAIAWAIR